MFWKVLTISANKLLFELLFLALTNLWPNSREAAVEKELKLDPISALNQQVIWITLYLEQSETGRICYPVSTVCSNGVLR